MKKILLIVASIILILTFFKDENNNLVIIPNDSIRLRVISNSTDELDIKKKQELKSYLESILYDLVKDVDSKDKINEIILENFDDINSKIYLFLGNNNYKLDYGQNYFPSKIYKGVIYNEGIYDSIVVTLGNGKGSNWWCVLFPPLCLLDENDTTTDVEYQLFVSRILENFR